MRTDLPETAAPPPSPSRARRIARLHRVARLMDSAFRVPIVGIRVGLDPLLGLLPAAGDLVGAAVSAWIVVSAARLGVPRDAILRMALNVGIDLLVGTVPVVGDLFDATFRANRRNVAILEEHLEGRSSAGEDSGEAGGHPRRHLPSDHRADAES